MIFEEYFSLEVYHHNKYGTVPASKAMRKFQVFWCMFCLVVITVGLVLMSNSLSNQSKAVDVINVLDVPENSYNKSRLPTDIVPASYVIKLQLNTALKSYTGYIKINILCKHSTSQIILHSSQHKFTKLEVRHKHERIDVQNLYRNGNEMLILELSQNLTAGEGYELSMDFHNMMYWLTYGIYPSKIMDGDEKKPEMVTSFEHVGARNAWPCFDEPLLKATWEIIVRHPKSGFNVLSNMPVKEKVNIDWNNMESTFFVTPKMSSHLVAVVVTDCVHKTVNSPSGVKVNVYAPASRLHETNFALKLAPMVTDFYAQMFGVKYPLPKLDLVPYPSLDTGAKEHWGLITAAESLILYKSTNSIKQFEKIAKTIVRAVSHQWFGALVTMKWWDDLWLKESLTSYFESVILKFYFPSWNPEIEFSSREMNKALDEDSSKFTRPITLDATHSNSLQNSLNNIMYSKGCAVINMFGKMLGNDLLFKGLKAYLSKYQFGNAEATQLWETISKVAPSVDAVTFMNLWVSQPGFPLVTFKKVGNTLIVKQERFGYKNSTSLKEEDVENSLWHIPITLKICGKITQFTLKTKTQVISLNFGCSSSAYFKANYGSMGYYRVNYDWKNWLHLLTLLNSNNTSLPPVDKGNLLADVNSLARNNYVDVTLLLDFTVYLRNEREFVPWKIGSQSLTDLRNVFYDTNTRNCIEEYMVKQISPVIDYLDTFTKHSHSQRKLVSLMLDHAIMVNMQPIVSQLQNLFLKWMISDGRRALPTHIRREILKAGVMNGNVNEWNFLLKKYENATSASEQEAMLHALTYTNDLQLLERLVGYIVQGNAIHKKDLVMVLTSVCRNPVRRQIAWKATKTVWVSLEERYTSNPQQLEQLLKACLGSGSSPADLAEAKQFKASVKPGMMEQMDRVIESVELNMNLKKKQKKVTTWFYKKVPGCLERSNILTGARNRIHEKLLE